MKKIVVIFFVFSYFYVVGQNTPSTNCQLLNKVISSKEFKEQFRFVKSMEEDLILIDTSKTFVCDTTHLINQKYYTSSFLPEEISLEKKTNIKHQNKLVIYKFYKKKGKYFISFWHPYTNGNLGLEVRKKKIKIDIKIIDSGVF